MGVWFVGWLMDGFFFWHFDIWLPYLNHLSLLQGYFWHFHEELKCDIKYLNYMKIWLKSGNYNKIQNNTLN